MNKETSSQGVVCQLDNLCVQQQGYWYSPAVMSIADNLKRRREAAGLSQPQLAAKAGVSQQLISQIERGENLTTKKLPQIARALGARVEDLDPDYGAPPPELRRVPIGEEFDPDPEFVEHPDRTDAARRFERRRLEPGEVVERNVTAGLGLGGDSPTVYADGQVVDEVRAVWRLPPDYLRTELSARETEVDFITVSGDSMTPTLLPGDKILVNRAIRQPGDGVYVIHDGVGPSVKRLEVNIGTSPLRIRILSDNPAHGPREILASDLVVIGKVIMRASRM